MYSSIYELPSQVLASLDEKDATKWMKVYNDLDPHTEKEIKKAKREAWHACKDLPSSFSFKIKASVDNIDRDREIIDVDSIKKHMDSYIDYGGNVQWEHGGYNVANIWDWEPIKVDGRDGVAVWGNIFGGDVVYDQMRKAFVDGKNSLSVAGEALPGKFQCDERGCYTRRDVKQLMEISLCAVPANNMCTMEWYNKNASFTKSESVKGGMRFNVDEYEIHKSYYECPMLSLKKSLEDIGYEAHATNAGVFIEMDDASFRKALPYMHANNLHVIRMGSKVCLNDYDYLTELSFKKGYEEGCIDKDGYVLDSIQKSDFETLYERDVLIQDDTGRYRLIPFGKDAEWKKHGEEGQKAVDKNKQPQKGIHFNWGVTDARKVGSANTLKLQQFDPDKFTLVTGYGNAPKGGYYEGVLKPNKHNDQFRDGKGISDARMTYTEQPDTDGIVSTLYPDAKILYIRDLKKDWLPLLDKYQTKINENSGSKELHWPSLLKDYDAVQFELKEPGDKPNERTGEKGNNMSRSKPGVTTALGEMLVDGLGGPYAGRSNYRIILNPYAVMSSEMYDVGNNTIGGIKSDKVAPRTTEWAPYDRQLDKLRERYKQAGIEVNW